MVYCVRFQNRVGRPCASAKTDVAASTRTSRANLGIANLVSKMGYDLLSKNVLRARATIARQKRSFIFASPYPGPALVEVSAPLIRFVMPPGKRTETAFRQAARIRDQLDLC